MNIKLRLTSIIFGKISFYFIFLLFSAINLLNADEPVSAEISRQQIKSAHDAFFANGSDKTFKAWYETASEAYHKFPYDTDIARRFAYVAMQYVSPAEGLKVLSPLIPEMKSDQNIAWGIWQVINRVRKNSVNSCYNYQLYLNNLSNEEAEIIINSQWKFWAGKVIHIEGLNPSNKKMILKARNCSAIQDVSPEEEVRGWRTIWENIYQQDLTTKLGSAIMGRYQSESAQILDIQKRRAKRKSETLKLLDQFSELPNEMQKIESIMKQVSPYIDKKASHNNLPNYQALSSRLKNPYELNVLNLAYKVLIRNEYEDCLSAIANIPHPDSRILELKIYCLVGSDKQIDEIASVVDEILKLKPNYPEMFMLKKKLDAERDYAELQKESLNKSQNY